MCYLALINQCDVALDFLRAQMKLNRRAALVPSESTQVSTCSPIKSTLTSAQITCVQGYRMDIFPPVEALLEALDIQFLLTLTREG